MVGEAVVGVVIIHIYPGCCTNYQLKSKERGDHAPSACVIITGSGRIQRIQSSERASNLFQLWLGKVGWRFSFISCAHADLTMPVYYLIVSVALCSAMYYLHEVTGAQRGTRSSWDWKLGSINPDFMHVSSLKCQHQNTSNEAGEIVRSGLCKTGHKRAVFEGLQLLGNSIIRDISPATEIQDGLQPQGWPQEINQGD